MLIFVAKSSYFIYSAWIWSSLSTLHPSQYAACMHSFNAWPLQTFLIQQQKRPKNMKYCWTVQSTVLFSRVRALWETLYEAFLSLHETRNDINNVTDNPSPQMNKIRLLLTRSSTTSDGILKPVRFILLHMHPWESASERDVVIFHSGKKDKKIKGHK